MKFKHDVIGPDFDNADIINFEFDGADLSLRLPKDPDSSPGYVAKQNQKILPTEPNNRWVTHPLGFRIFDMVRQSWSYRDEQSYVRVASEHFDLYLIELPDEIYPELNPLNKQQFLEWLFRFFRLISVRGDESLLNSEVELENMKAHMMPLSIEQIEIHPAGILDWSMLTISMPYEDDDEANANRDPDYFIYIPLNERLFLYIDHSLGILSSESTPITLPKTEILALKREILNEILAHIKVTYSPEVLKLIEEQNSQA
ncbi:MAG TPA: hypothetical protein VLC79_06095 [Cellvibrio sp.]|nr:hypothetical protein [Cellvibrio sp.]